MVGARRVVLRLGFATGLLLASYALLEGGARLLVDHLAVTRDLAETLRRVERLEMTIDQFVHEISRSPSGERLDPELGWDRSSTLLRGCSGPRPDRILWLGDSVTVGLTVEPDERYLARLAADPRPPCREIVDAAVTGFGIHQMTLKADRELPRFQPDLTVFAVIDHDLVRSSRDFLFRFTKPAFRPARGGGYEWRPPRPLADALRAYREARRRGTVGLFSLQRAWEARRYYLPQLYDAYYRALVADTLSHWQQQTAEHGSRLAVLRIPQAVRFPGAAAVDAIFRDELARASARAPLLAPDLEPCLRRRLALQGARFDDVMARPHPPAPGHEALAHCIRQELLERL